MTRLPSTATLALAALLAGCAAPKAVLYNEGGARQQAQAERALHSCEQQAHSAVGLNAGHQATARKAGTKGTVEVVESVVRSMVRGTAVVARSVVAAGVAGAAGAVTEGALDHNEPDKVYEEYVKLCMRKNGHSVLGWR